MSPPIYVPIGMALAGLLGLLALQALIIYKAPMIFGPFRFNPAALAAVHLFTLGFATSVMIGAFHQITPVMMLGRPVEGGWALLQGAAYLAGSWALVWGFYRSAGPWITAGGTLVVLALRRLRRAGGQGHAVRHPVDRRRPLHGGGPLVRAGHGDLGPGPGVQPAAGFLPDSLDYSPLGAHVLVGLGGWFMLTIFGVSYQLFPMFALTNRPGAASGHAVLACSRRGSGARSCTAAPAPAGARPPLPAARRGRCGPLRRRLLRHDAAAPPARTRPLHALWGDRAGLPRAGRALLLLSVRHRALAVPGAWLFLFGFVATMILGMLYKIVPFLVWHYLMKHRRAKTQRLPKLDEMFSQRTARAGYFCWTAGVLLTGLLLLGGALGWWDARYLVRGSAILNLIGSLLFAGTILQVLRARPLD